MDIDPQGGHRQKPAMIKRAATSTGGWLRHHPLGALQAILLILLVIVIAQNLEPTSIDVLFWSAARLPKLVIILISMLLGALLWEAIRRRWRRPHRARGATVTNRTHP
jgi:uncharacterized integral membrane protein